MIFGKETDFKETKTGRFPSDWQDAKLEDVLSQLRNGIVASQNKEGRGIPITRIETISDEKIDLNKLGYLEKANGLNYDNFLLTDGDILFSHINSLEHIGKTALYEGVPESLLHGMNLLLLRPKKDVLNPKYLVYLLKLFRQRNLFRAIAKKAVNQASINQTELGRVRVPIPPMFEQQGIVEVLSCVDLAIKKTDEVIAKTERFKKGLIQKLLREGIGHREFKDSDIGRIPKAWESATFEEVTTRITYGFTNPMPHVEKGHYIVTAKNVGDGRIDYSSANMTTEEAYCNLLTDKSRPKKGDVLFTKDGTIGKAAVVDRDSICISQSVALLIPKENLVRASYLSWTLQSPAIQSLVNYHSATTTIPHLAITKLAKMKLGLPSLTEQQAISDVLSTANRRCQLERDEKTRLKRIRQGLLDILLTGKVRVKVD
ncbi:MAG: restriction endonuclease subunit S [Candidatus Bathyarchaeia archaeon]